METKVCTKCKEVKPLSEFGIRKERNNRPRSACKKCDSKQSQKWNENHREKFRQNDMAYYYRNREEILSRIDREAKRQYDKVYHKNNLDKSAASSSKRRAMKKSNTPKWATEKYIELFFTHSQLEQERTGKKCHVDHIVPLKGKIQGVHVVCGLHCEDNLQVLFASDNLKKWCHTWPNMP